MDFYQILMEHEDIAYNKGIDNAYQKIAINMLKYGLSAEMIMKYTELSLDEVNEIEASLHLENATNN